MSEEIWRTIDNYENYQISNLGRVRNIKFNRILKIGKDGKGYKCVSLSKNGCSKLFFIHRLVAIAFIPNPENKRVVNHIDENKTNNDISNLEWCSQYENIIHSIKLHLDDNKLSVEDVQYIRENAVRGKHKEMAEKFGVSKSYISKITRGVKCGWVDNYKETHENDKYRGENVVQTKLTEENVRYIRENAVKGKYKEMAEKFGVSSDIIGRIVNRTRWGWLK